MTLPDAFRTSTFRISALASAMVAVGMLLLFAFIYWQTAGYEAAGIGQFVRNEAAAIAREPPGDIGRDVAARFAGDLHRQTFAAIVEPDGQISVGDLYVLPPDLPIDGLPHHTLATRLVAGQPAGERVTAVARRLADGRVLVVGRSEKELAELRGVVARALELGLIPGVLLALAAGTFASLRTLARVQAVNRALDRIIDGDMRERLPTRGTHDTLDALAERVNRMLDVVERLMEEIKGVGDSIAHDLRTPLARLRSQLEGGRKRAGSQAELDRVVGQAIVALDQTFAIITALLRIGEIESGQRRAGFSRVSLDAIVVEAADLYQPMAELRDIRFEVAVVPDQVVTGDRDLLFEAVANLLDNAVKFAPSGGWVRLALTEGPVLHVQDSGAGIALPERDAVLQRFYRADPSRHAQGSGLGLSLVAAILRLHGFTLTMGDLHPGFTMEIHARAAGPGETAAP